MSRHPLSKPRDIDDLWIFAAGDDLVTAVVPYLPVWLSYVLAVPFWAVLALLCAVEYALRLLLTPAKYWNAQ